MNLGWGGGRGGRGGEVMLGGVGVNVSSREKDRGEVCRIDGLCVHGKKAAELTHCSH